MKEASSTAWEFPFVEVLVPGAASQLSVVMTLRHGVECPFFCKPIIGIDCGTERWIMAEAAAAAASSSGGGGGSSSNSSGDGLAEAIMAAAVAAGNGKNTIIAQSSAA
jgi:hypothetical protein